MSCRFVMSWESFLSIQLHWLRWAKLVRACLGNYIFAQWECLLVSANKCSLIGLQFFNLHKLIHVLFNWTARTLVIDQICLPQFWSLPKMILHFLLCTNHTNRSARANWKIKRNVSTWALVSWHDDKNQRLQLSHNHCWWDSCRQRRLITEQKITSAFSPHSSPCFLFIIFFSPFAFVALHITKKFSHIIFVCLSALVIMLYCAGVCGRSTDLNFIVWWINLPAGHVSAFPFAPATQC